MTVVSAKERWPLVARWTQSTDEGAIHWYLRGLQPDGRLWGYAHFRLRSKHENRSFAGILPADLLLQITTIVDGFDSPGEQSERSGSLIGIRTRSSLQPLFELPIKADKALDPKFAAAYRSFVELLQPAVTQALADNFDDRED